MPRRDQSPVVLADRFSNWVNPRARGHVVQKEINPENSVNGRQTTAEIWSPDYQWNVRSQTAMMDCRTRRVRLFECVQKHVSSSENAPPNASFWRELISSQSKEHDVMSVGHRNASKESRSSSKDSHGMNSERRHRNSGTQTSRETIQKRAMSAARPGHERAMDISRTPPSPGAVTHVHSQMLRSRRAYQDNNW